MHKTVAERGARILAGVLVEKWQRRRPVVGHVSSGGNVSWLLSLAVRRLCAGANRLLEAGPSSQWQNAVASLSRSAAIRNCKARVGRRECVCVSVFRCDRVVASRPLRRVCVYACVCEPKGGVLIFRM